MYTYILTYIYICIYIYIYIYIHPTLARDASTRRAVNPMRIALCNEMYNILCIYICIYIYIYIYMYLYIYMYTDLCVYICAYMYMCICEYVYMCICVYVCILLMTENNMSVVVVFVVLASCKNTLTLKGCASRNCVCVSIFVNMHICEYVCIKVYVFMTERKNISVVFVVLVS